MTMTAQERAILALCRMEGRSLECGWLTFDKLTPAEKMTFAENIWPLIKPRLPILAAEFEAAAAALDGEGESPQEEWTALIDDIDRHRLEGYPISAPNHIIAVCIDIPTACRVARLPKLERAVREVLAHRHEIPTEPKHFGRLLDNLSAALNDSTGG